MFWVLASKAFIHLSCRVKFSVSDPRGSRRLMSPAFLSAVAARIVSDWTAGGLVVVVLATAAAAVVVVVAAAMVLTSRLMIVVNVDVVNVVDVAVLIFAVSCDLCTQTW